VEIPVPENLKDTANKMREDLKERAAEQTDELMEKYLN
jgi:translation elongation factor EF-G